MAIRKTAGYAWNLISLIGMILAVTAAALIVVFFAFEMITGVEHAYLGLMTYFMFPGMLIFGLLLVPFGAWRVRNERRKAAIEGMVSLEEEIPQFPRLDLNDPHRRHLFIFFILASVVFVVIVAIASIKGFEFTESTVFCGEVCHVVMEPEHTAWSNSPHAKVKCVECHVGPGAAWYVKAKISGMRQLYAVVFHTYPETIETPIDNLRPARETCEHCHWPEKFYVGRQKIFNHYAPNEENTPRSIDMLIHIGGNPKSPNSQRYPLAHRQRGYLYCPRQEKTRYPLCGRQGQGRQTDRILKHRKPAHQGRDRKREQAVDGLHRLPQPADPYLSLTW